MAAALVRAGHTGLAATRRPAPARPRGRSGVCFEVSPARRRSFRSPLHTDCSTLIPGRQFEALRIRATPENCEDALRAAVITELGWLGLFSAKSWRGLGYTQPNWSHRTWHGCARLVSQSVQRLDVGGRRASACPLKIESPPRETGSSRPRRWHAASSGTVGGAGSCAALCAGDQNTCGSGAASLASSCHRPL